MDVLTSETCWALNNEITKQVTSSWSLFIQYNEIINKWHQVGLSLFNYQDDARSNEHKTNFLSAELRIILSGPCLWLPFPRRTSWSQCKIVYCQYAICSWVFKEREREGIPLWYEQAHSGCVILSVPKLWTFRLLAVCQRENLYRKEKSNSCWRHSANPSRCQTTPGAHDQILVYVWVCHLQESLWFS